VTTQRIQVLWFLKKKYTSTMVPALPIPELCPVPAARREKVDSGLTNPSSALMRERVCIIKSPSST
jgi:hypothetical protein